MKVERKGTVTFDRADIVRILRREAQSVLGYADPDIVEGRGGVYDAKQKGHVVLPYDLDVKVEFL